MTLPNKKPHEQVVFSAVEANNLLKNILDRSKSIEVALPLEVSTVKKLKILLDIVCNAEDYTIERAIGNSPKTFLWGSEYCLVLAYFLQDKKEVQRAKEFTFFVQQSFLYAPQPYSH